MNHHYLLCGVGGGFLGSKYQFTFKIKFPAQLHVHVQYVHCGTIQRNCVYIHCTYHVHCTYVLYIIYANYDNYMYIHVEAQGWGVQVCGTVCVSTCM